MLKTKKIKDLRDIRNPHHVRWAYQKNHGLKIKVCERVVRGFGHWIESRGQVKIWGGGREQ